VEGERTGLMTPWSRSKKCRFDRVSCLSLLCSRENVCSSRKLLNVQQEGSSVRQFYTPVVIEHTIE
jgi:hypothetical protein